MTDAEPRGKRNGQPDTAVGVWVRKREVCDAPRVKIAVDGHTVQLVEGECLATGLAAAGIMRLGKSPCGRPRGAWCLMGTCQQCTALVDGTLQRTCMVPVRAGITVVTGFRPVS